ncbi:MAG TPA: SDR family oxidoreductase [Firmicutes bacterium]|nr:SDR family oxidoreductase [Bacillota bacterium]
MEGKTALITGGAKRIGRAISLACAKEGANVVVHYNHSSTEADSLCDEIKKSGVKAISLQADFSGENFSPTGLIEKSLELTGLLDFLINSASVFPESKIDTVTFDDLAGAMRINSWVPFELSREFVKKCGKGKIINLLDTRHLDFDWNHVAYILSKKMLAEMTRMMAVHFAPDVQVNAVAPGLILPPPGKDMKYIENLVHTVPLNKHGDAGDVADAVIYLLKSSFLTGEVIYVDGGRHLKGYRNG